jgi:hypothetical protein
MLASLGGSLLSDLRTGEVHQFDVGSLRSFKCPEEVDPLEIAAMDKVNSSWISF